MPQRLSHGKVIDDFFALDAKPELASNIAKISSLWSRIDDQLALLFSLGMGSEPAIAAAVMGCTANLATRLAMINTALKHGISLASAKHFETELTAKIRKGAKRRNRIAHAIWLTHPSYPNDLIRFAGMTDPTLSTERWSQKDFIEVLLSLAKLLHSLQTFYESLAQDQRTPSDEEKAPYWRPSGNDLGLEGDLSQ